MKQILAESGIRLTKSLGQNFLHDANQLQRITALAELRSEDQVLEIGPGLGPLTSLLLTKAKLVLAIEKDQKLAKVLESLNTAAIHAGKLKLIQADALDYLKNVSCDWRQWKLVANLPYSVASPILVELALAENGPERMVVTLQSDVARRLIAKPGGEDYGVLTLLVQLNYQPKEFFRIPASCFFPEPDVESACISLIRRAEPLSNTEEKRVFVRLVKKGFSQRRKMMMKLLKEEWPVQALAEAFDEISLSHQARAEKVSLEQFVTLSKIIRQKKQRP